MNKEQIIAEIRRLADENHGRPPGKQVFESKTGLRRSEWYPHVWLRWGDALREAGFSPNEFQAKTSDAVIVEKYIELVRELKRLPVEGEIKRKARSDTSFPNPDAFRRFGGRNQLL